MGILAMATADLQDLDMLNYHENRSAWEISSDTARTGTYSFKCNNGNYDSGVTIPAISEGYVKVAIYQTGSIYLKESTDTGSRQIQINLGVSGVDIYRYTTLIDSVSGLTVSGWTCVEVYFIIDNSSGIIQIKIDGNQVIDFSGDTQYQPTSNITNITFFGTTKYFDDIIVRDDQWPGRGGIHVLTPNAGTDTENWVPSAGNPEDCVDELPVSYTDYLYTPHEPSGVEHLFNLEALPVSGDIKAVGVAHNAKLEVSTDGNCRNIIRSGSTMASGELRGLNTSESWGVDYFDTDPATAGAWTAAAIESLEIGVEN